MENLSQDRGWRLEELRTTGQLQNGTKVSSRLDRDRWGVKGVLATSISLASELSPGVCLLEWFDPS